MKKNDPPKLGILLGITSKYNFKIFIFKILYYMDTASDTEQPFKPPPKKNDVSALGICFFNKTTFSLITNFS